MRNFPLSPASSDLSSATPKNRTNRRRDPVLLRISFSHLNSFLLSSRGNSRVAGQAYPPGRNYGIYFLGSGVSVARPKLL